TFILQEIRQQGLFLCLSEFYLAPRVYYMFLDLPSTPHQKQYLLVTQLYTYYRSVLNQPSMV
ncbi:hypothetical protein FOI67_16815, partial [Geobacillus sp. LEMMJ02]